MDKYKVNSLIGEGSFGRVYKAIKKSDCKTVAIKVISKQRGQFPKKDLKNLRRECNIQARLDHLNIIKIYESFETKNELFLITEYCQIDLHRYLCKNGTITENEVQILSGHLISALYYLHANRILHRDLKPQNVLLDEKLLPKLCDFGLARNMTMKTEFLTSIKGTPLYMAPEIMAGKPYDHQADLWSLGCIIYECLVGSPPFTAISIGPLLRLVQDEDVKWPSFISNECVSLLQGFLEKNPVLRISWAQILCHPFVDEKLNIPKNCKITEPVLIGNSSKQDFSAKNTSEKKVNQENALSSSKDSINAILQSDIENLETDDENLQYAVPFDKAAKLPFVEKRITLVENMCKVSGNGNLIITNFADNFPEDSELKSMKITAATSSTSSRNKELEKRKLSQNLENFSLRLSDRNNEKRFADEDNRQHKIGTKISTELTVSKNTPPCLPPGWDSSCDSESPPIENEEWLAFLNRSMQEILDGDFDSMKQHNFVSIIVAPLRNSKAGPIYESISKLLILPLLLGGPDLIKTIFIEVKVIPNLIYASKLITSDIAEDSLSNLRSIDELKFYEINTLDVIFEVVCHLVHLNERFLFQFCDAMLILTPNDLFLNLLNTKLEKTARIKNNIFGLFCCVLISSPENAELVENIIFEKKFDLISLIKSCKCKKLIARICKLFRLLGRFSLSSLQNIWSSNSMVRVIFEDLANNDECELVRIEAESLLNELKQFSFYS